MAAIAASRISRSDVVMGEIVSRSDFLAISGMVLVISGVLFFLIRDLRYRFESVQRFFYRFESRAWYAPFIAPISTVVGVLLILLGFVLG